MDRTERELKRWMRKKERERTRPWRTFWILVAIAVVLCLLVAIINRTHIVLWFGFYN